MRRPILLVLVLLLLVAAAAAVAWHWRKRRSEEAGHQVRISGNIEVIDAQVGFKIAGRVEKRPVDEGYEVREGDLIAQLDSSDLKHEVGLRRAEHAAAKASLAALEAGSRAEEIAAAQAAMLKAQAVLAELEAGSRPQEIAVAEAAVESATADRDRLQADFNRARKLWKTKTISDEDYDRIRAAVDVAVAKLREARERLALVREGPRYEQIQQARAALAQAKAQYELVKAGPRQEDIQAGRARAEQALEALRLAETRLGYATLLAPMNGVVLSKNTEPGEYVAPGTPVVTLADLKNIWLRGYINETDLGRVKLGQKALVRTDTRPGKTYVGRVSFISDQAEFTPKTVQTQQERVKLVYRIKVDIDNPHRELKPGMPADAEILLDEATSPSPSGGS